jgi:hypothetical protein
MDHLLPIICIHSYDIITTKKLLCTSKSAFAGVKDIWNEKLIYEYPNVEYLWFGNPINLPNAFRQGKITQTQAERNKYSLHEYSDMSKYLSFHNYCSRKINEFCLVFHTCNACISLDNALYEDSSAIRRTLLNINTLQNNTSDYIGFIDLNFKNILNRFAIFESRDSDEWVFIKSFSSTEDVKCFLNTNKEERKDYITPHVYEDLVIDLRGLFPYYVSLDNKHELNKYGDIYVDTSVDGKWYFYEHSLFPSSNFHP